MGEAIHKKKWGFRFYKTLGPQIMNKIILLISKPIPLSILHKLFAKNMNPAQHI